MKKLKNVAVTTIVALPISAEADQSFSIMYMDCSFLEAISETPEIFQPDFVLYVQGVIDGVKSRAPDPRLVEPALEHYCAEFPGRIGHVIESALLTPEITAYFAARTNEVRFQEALEASD